MSQICIGMQISWTKTKIWNIGIGTPCNNFLLRGNIVKEVSKFICLGSEMTSSGNSRPKVLRCISLAAIVMTDFTDSDETGMYPLSIHTKVRLYQSLVLIILLYAGETWTLLVADLKTLEALHMRCQHRFLSTHWFNGIINTMVQSITGLPTICSLLQNH